MSLKAFEITSNNLHLEFNMVIVILFKLPNLYNLMLAQVISLISNMKFLGIVLSST